MSEVQQRVQATLAYLDEMLCEYKWELDEHGTCPAEAFVAATAYELLSGTPHQFDAEVLSQIEFEDDGTEVLVAKKKKEDNGNEYH